MLRKNNWQLKVILGPVVSHFGLQHHSNKTPELVHVETMQTFNLQFGTVRRPAGVSDWKVLFLF